MESYSQDEINYGTSEFRKFEADTNEDSDYYMEYYARRRRQTLFNLYAFTLTDSYQKDVGEGANRTVKSNKDFQIPTLVLTNVEFRNFLYDYHSLIHIENNNFNTYENFVNPSEISFARSTPSKKPSEIGFARRTHSKNQDLRAASYRKINPNPYRTHVAKSLENILKNDFRTFLNRNLLCEAGEILKERKKES